MLGGCTDRQPLMTDQAGMEPMTMNPGGQQALLRLLVRRIVTLRNRASPR